MKLDFAAVSVPQINKYRYLSAFFILFVLSNLSLLSFCYDSDSQLDQPKQVSDDTQSEQNQQDGQNWLQAHNEKNKGKTLTLPLYFSTPKQDQQKKQDAPDKQQNQESGLDWLDAYNQKNKGRTLTLPLIYQPPKQDSNTYSKYLSQFKPNQNNDKNNEKALFRKLSYFKNLQQILKHNSDPKNKYEKGVNIYTNYDQDQFNKMFNTLTNIGDRIDNAAYNMISKPPRIKIDWRCLDSYPIYQGECRSSYAISALSSIQITKRIHNQRASYLSILQILQCGQNERNVDGCAGGYFDGVFDYAIKYGVGQSRTYYYSIDAQNLGKVNNCDTKLINRKEYLRNKVFIKDAVRIKRGDCQQIVNQLKFRSLAVAIASSGLQYYVRGIFETRNSNINHGVTLVGYEPSRGYLIKNSYGVKWGMNGYAYVNQSTGICQYAMYPILINEQRQLKSSSC